MFRFVFVNINSELTEISNKFTSTDFVFKKKQIKTITKSKIADDKKVEQKQQLTIFICVHALKDELKPSLVVLHVMRELIERKRTRSIFVTFQDKFLIYQRDKK